MRPVTRWRRSGSRFGWLPLGLAAAVLTAVLASVALAQSPELEPPGRPQALQAVVSHDMVSLSWDDPGDASISGYQILRRLRDHSPVGQFEVLVEDTGSAASAYVDRQVQPETRYNYRVKARNAAGLSPRSNFVRADTPPAPVLKQAKQEQQEQEDQQQQEEQPEEQVDEPGHRAGHGLDRSVDGRRVQRGRAAGARLCGMDQAGRAGAARLQLRGRVLHRAGAVRARRRPEPGAGPAAAARLRAGAGSAPLRVRPESGAGVRLGRPLLVAGHDAGLGGGRGAHGQHHPRSERSRPPSARRRRPRPTSPSCRRRTTAAIRSRSSWSSTSRTCR